MKEILVIKKILENKLLPEKIKRAMEGGKHKTSVSSITKERVMHLYELRKENNSNDDAYKEVNLEIGKILQYLKSSNYNIILMTNVISPDIYAIIFTDEQADQIIGVLDLTGLGNTSNYSASLFN